ANRPLRYCWASAARKVASPGASLACAPVQTPAADAPRTSMSSRTFRAAFSLIELVTVIAIIGIILGIVVPAWSGMGRGKALVTAGNLVNDMADLARQHAMSRNTLSALLVLANQGTNSDYR